MYSRDHLLHSTLVGVLVALAVGSSPVRGAGLVAFAAVVGTAIDADHFLLARWNNGDWRALRYLLGRPSAAVLDQAAIFEPGEVGTLHRLLSHVLLGGALVAGLASVRPTLALLAALVLYVHVVADLWHDLGQDAVLASGRA